MCAEGGPNRPPAQLATQRLPQQAGSVSSLDGASQQSCPTLEEQEILVPSQILQERDGAGVHRPATSNVITRKSGPSEQFGVPAPLVLFRLVDGLPLPATPRHAPTRQRRDDDGVNGDLLGPPEWKAVGDDLNPALVICRCHDVEIAKIRAMHTSAGVPRREHADMGGGTGRLKC